MKKSKKGPSAQRFIKGLFGTKPERFMRMSSAEWSTTKQFLAGAMGIPFVLVFWGKVIVRIFIRFLFRWPTRRKFHRDLRLVLPFPKRRKGQFQVITAGQNFMKKEKDGNLWMLRKPGNIPRERRPISGILT